MSHITTSSNYQGLILHQSQNILSKVLSSGNVLWPGQSMTGEDCNADGEVHVFQQKKKKTKFQSLPISKEFWYQ